MPTPEELNRTGMEFYKSGLLPEAIAAWEGAVAQKPDFVPCHINLSLAFLKKSRPDDAIRAAQKAVDFAPHHGACHFHLGNALSAKGRWNEAVTAYARAFELDRLQLNALILAGALLLDHGLEDRALEFWKRFLAAAPADHPKRLEVQTEVAAYESRKPLIRKF
jgi:tetratricopeptide (TPR) repeat protein